MSKPNYDLNVEAFFARIDDIERRLSALEGQPKQSNGCTDEEQAIEELDAKAYEHFISIPDYGDFWMPYDPAHPEPPAPPEEK